MGVITIILFFGAFGAIFWGRLRRPTTTTTTTLVVELLLKFGLMWMMEMIGMFVCLVAAAVAAAAVAAGVVAAGVVAVVAVAVFDGQLVGD